ncbi:MAG: hypothetical protein GY710_01745 [Desulfobacteraceae bacterium]|nr:hypothetical protein [Desulfobacteraceae bacterium]
MDLARPSLHYHLSKMPALAFSTNRDLSQGFTVTPGGAKAWLDRTDGLVTGPSKIIVKDSRSLAGVSGPGIKPYTWTLSSDGQLSWPVSSKGKVDLIIFDPPCDSINKPRMDTAP